MKSHQERERTFHPHCTNLLVPPMLAPARIRIRLIKFHFTVDCAFHERAPRAPRLPARQQFLCPRLSRTLTHDFYRYTKGDNMVFYNVRPPSRHVLDFSGVDVVEQGVHREVSPQSVLLGRTKRCFRDAAVGAGEGANVACSRARQTPVCSDEKCLASDGAANDIERELGRISSAMQLLFGRKTSAQDDGVVNYIETRRPRRASYGPSHPSASM